MRKTLFFPIITFTMSLGLLSGCGVDNNRMNNDDDVNTSPVRYDEDDYRFNNGRDVTPIRFNEDNANDIRDGIMNRNNNGTFNDDNRNNDLMNNGVRNDNRDGLRRGGNWGNLTGQ